MSQSRLQNYWAEYLLPYADAPDAVEDKNCKGFFHHKTMLAGNSENEVVAEIRKKGGVPVKVEVVKPPHPIWDYQHITRAYKQQILTAILYNMEAGLSASRALWHVFESESGAMRERMDRGLNILRQGGSFYEAICAIDFYDNTTLAILESGERSGSVRQALKTAVQHYSASATALKSMAGSLFVVGMDGFFAVTSVFGVRFTLLPSVASQGDQINDPVKKEAFQKSLDLAYWINDTMIVLTVILLIALGVGAWSYFGNNRQVRAWVDSKIETIPFLKDAVLHRAFANSCKIVATLLNGGVLFLNALEIVTNGVKQTQVRTYWESIIRRVRNGDAVAVAMAQNILTRAERVVVLAHADQHQLAEILSSISEARSQQADAATKRFISAVVASTMVYIAATVLSALWVLYVQNSAYMTGVGAGS